MENNQARRVSQREISHRGNSEGIEELVGHCKDSYNESKRWIQEKIGLSYQWLVNPEERLSRIVMIPLENLCLEKREFMPSRIFFFFSHCGVLEHRKAIPHPFGLITCGYLPVFPCGICVAVEKKQLMFLNQFNHSLKKEIMPIENIFSKLPNAKIPLFSWYSVSVLRAIGWYHFWQQAVADRDMLILVLPVSSLPS